MIKVLERSVIQGTYLNIIKSNLQQANSHHQIKWRETQNDFSKISNNTKLSTLSLFLQHSFWSFHYSNKTTKGEQGDSDRKGRSQNCIICRSYHNIYKWSPKLFQRTPTADKYIQWCGRIQYQLKKISLLFPTGDFDSSSMSILSSRTVCIFYSRT